MTDVERRPLMGSRRSVLHERAGEKLALAVVEQLLHRLVSRRSGPHSWFQRGSQRTRTHHDAKATGIRDILRFREGMRRIAGRYVGVGRDYESVALPLSYPGVSR